MSDRISLPVRVFGNEKWCSLEFGGIKHTAVVAYKVIDGNEQFSFAGGHRVRLVKFWNNIHFKLPEGTALDITDVKAASSPPKRRHNKGR